MSTDPNVSQAPGNGGLPAHVSGQAGTPSPAPSRKVPAPATRLHARRVVIACGDPHLAEGIERILKHHADELAPEGLEVRRVHDGLTCLQDIQMVRPSLLVLHARLDRMSAEEILQAWDAAHPGDTVPAIVLSSQFGSDVPAGMPGAVVVRLPCDNAELVAIAARALESDRSGNA